MRDVYKILGITWNEKDEEWFGNMPKIYLDMWNGKKPTTAADKLALIKKKA